MASNYSEELVEQLQTYIDTSLTSQKLAELLNQTSADGRYKLLSEVRAGKFTWTGLYAAVRRNDTGIVKLMTRGWTTEQTFTVVKLTTRYGRIALHAAAYSESTAAVRYLLERLDQDQIFCLLMMRDVYGDTPLHDAVARGHHELAKLIIASVNVTNQVELLAVKNNKNKSVVELSNYPLCLQAQLQVGLATQRKEFVRKLSQQKADHDEQQRASTERIRQLEAELAEQRRTFMKRINQQEEEMAEQQRAFTQRANQQEREIQKLTQNFNRLEVYLRTPEVSDARGDQEIEDN